MKRAELLEFLRSQRYAVQATVAETGAPQAAVVGIVVTDELELFFDTLDTTRKARNLRANPRLAFVIGGTCGDQRSVQYEGIADLPAGAELARLQERYFERFPDGRARQAWKGLIYIRTRPTWLRYSDYNRDPPLVVEKRLR